MGSCGRNDECGNGNERRKVRGYARGPARGVLEAERIVLPDRWSGQSPAARVRGEQSGALLGSRGKSEGL